MDERMMATMEQILQEMRQNRALLEQMEETQQDQARLLQEYGRLLQEQGEDLLKIKIGRASCRERV